MECYERLKGKEGGAAGFDTQSTGITLAVTDKAPIDKVSVVTPGYGLAQSVDGKVFEWELPAAGHLLDRSRLDRAGHPEEGKGQPSWVYSDRARSPRLVPYGKEPIPVLQRAEKEGFRCRCCP